VRTQSRLWLNSAQIEHLHLHLHQRTLSMPKYKRGQRPSYALSSAGAKAKRLQVVQRQKRYNPQLGLYFAGPRVIGVGLNEFENEHFQLIGVDVSMPHPRLGESQPTLYIAARNKRTGRTMAVNLSWAPHIFAFTASVIQRFKQIMQTPLRLSIERRGHALQAHAQAHNVNLTSWLCGSALEVH